MIAQMNAVDSDDVISMLGTIAVQIYERKYLDGLSTLQNLKNMIEDSPKLVNLAAVCYMGNRDFAKADSALKNLENFFKENKEKQFTHEYAACLRNLYVAALHLGKYEMCDSRNAKFKSDIVEKLKKLTDDNDPLLEKAQQLERLFAEAEGAAEQ